MGGEAIYIWDMGGLNVLIPKRRGQGFLRCPLGHHRVNALASIEEDERIDLCGLEVYLSLDYGILLDEARDAIITRVMPRLACHYGFTSWVEDREKFWENLNPQKHGG